MEPIYITDIDISDLPLLNDNYDLSAPYSKHKFETPRSNFLRRTTGVFKEKWNFDNVHEIMPWKDICARVTNSIKPYYDLIGDDSTTYSILSSWLSAYLNPGESVMWHKHHNTDYPFDATALLFLTSHPTPLLVSRLPGNSYMKTQKIVVTDTIDTVAGRLVIFGGDVFHMVPPIDQPGRWTLAIQFKKSSQIT
jgi:hypothetical protein